MAYSIKDIENITSKAAENIRDTLEQRSQRQGEEIANRIIKQTSQGRGLWAIFLWPAWFLIFVFSGVFLKGLIELLGIQAPISWIGMVGGFIFARAWYHSEFTINHPFWGSVLGYFGIALAVKFLAKKFGIHL